MVVLAVPVKALQLPALGFVSRLYGSYKLGGEFSWEGFRYWQPCGPEIQHRANAFFTLTAVLI